VWGYREGVRSRTLDVHVQRLRKKLGPAEGAKILTVFRGGYLWADNGAPALRSPGAAPQEPAAAD
jgi:DNA-binding response OmpR family regulator